MKHVAVNVSHMVKAIEGMSYIAWADALAIVNPVQHIVLHPEAGVVHPVFGGGVVAVDQGLPSGQLQRTQLVILNAKGAPIPYANITSRDVGDAINRCRARSVAVVDGLGLGLYLDTPDGAQFLRGLGVNAGTQDLTKVAPWLLKKGGKDGGRPGAEYLPWAAAIAAARITDPDFHWSVAKFHTVDPDGVAGEQPYIRVPHGFMVAVDLTWKGLSHREYLPIMGVLPVQTRNGIKKMDHQPLTAPDAHDWHRSVMRCLAKGIAMLTGYGRSAYADELGVGANVEMGLDPAMVEQIQVLVANTKADLRAMLSHFGVPSIEAASPEVAEKMLAALQSKAEKMAAGAKPLPESPVPPPLPEEGAKESAPAGQRDLLKQIEAMARDKRVSDQMLASFAGNKPLQEIDAPALQRVLKALERCKPNAAAEAG